MVFTSCKNEMNGVYLNVQRQKHGSHVNLTIRCSICGRVFERSNNTLLRKDLSRCICDEFEKGEQYKQNRAKGKAVEDPYYSRCKTNFNVYLKEKLKKFPTLRYDDFDTIWKAVGKKPEDTEFCRYYLTRKDRGRKNPNFTADNMEWHPITTCKAVTMVKSVTCNKTHRNCVAYAKAAKFSKSEDEFLNCIQTAPKRKRTLEDYEALVGRKMKSFRITDITKSVSKERSQYFLTLKCERCGKIVFRPASKVIDDCRPCRCRSSVGINAKNSSTCGSRNLMKKKYRHFIRTTTHSLSQDEILLLQAHISEFTLYMGTPEYIYLKLDAEMMGIQL